MAFDYRKCAGAIAAALLLTCMAMPVAHAEDDDDDEEEFALPMVSNAKWKAECGSCHVAFPPHMLPANSWRALMSGLEKHFGTDASLDAATGNEIAAFLEKNAGRRWSESAVKLQLRIAPQLRITESRWFRSEHQDVGARVWSNPRVKSPANCAACHTQAENGHFGEHEIKIPKS